MGHPTAKTELIDALVDFPVAVLLRRSGLLRTVLDILGAPIANGSSDGFKK